MSLELRIAEPAAHAGAEVALRHFQDFANQVKPGEPSFNRISVADVESEHAIVDVIRREFPNYAILAGEAHSADAKAEHLWVIDPIDGTNNFLHGIPQFGISVAYYRAGQPVCGVILNPARGDSFVASRGHGAFHNGQQVRDSEHRCLDEVLIGLGFYYDRGALMERAASCARTKIRMTAENLSRKSRRVRPIAMLPFFGKRFRCCRLLAIGFRPARRDRITPTYYGGRVDSPGRGRDGIVSSRLPGFCEQTLL